MASPMAEVIDGYRVLKDYDHELGRGTFAVVWRAIDLRSGEQVAVKRVKPGDNTEEGREFTRKYIDFEIEALRTINHRNVVKLYHTTKKDGFVYLFIEFCEKGNLAEFVKDMALSEVTCLSFMRDLANAVCCLHECVPPIIHRDIKPDNLLVTKDVSVPAGYLVKLTDFGIARRVESLAGPAFTLCGTANWMAPEVRPDEHGRVNYDKEADLFSMALVDLSLLDHVIGQILTAFRVAGLNLGDWISRQSKPVKLPNIMKSGDDRYKVVLKTFLLRMLCPKPSDRCSIQLVCDTINHHYENAVAAAAESAPVPAAGYAPVPAAGYAPVPDAGYAPVPDAGYAPIPDAGYVSVISCLPGPAAGSARGPAAGSAPDHAAGSAPDHAAGSAPGAAAKFPADGAAGAAPVLPVRRASPIKVKQICQITLPDRGPAHLWFGHMDDILVICKAFPKKLCRYKYESNGFKFEWEKELPAGLEYNCLQYTSPAGEIFLQTKLTEVRVYDRTLRLTKKLQSLGWVICLLAGGRLAVVDNRASVSWAVAGIRLSVLSFTTYDVLYRLDVPRAGQYTADDELRACGREDGRVAVIVRQRAFIDVYDASGRHECRTELPGGARKPQCSSSHILVSLQRQPTICVLGWSGQLLHTLGHEQLLLRSDDVGLAVSPVHEGRFSFWVGRGGEHQVHTYQIIPQRSSSKYKPS